MALLKHRKNPWDKFYPNGKNTVAVPNESIYERFLSSVKEHGNLVALNYFNKKITFDMLSDQINQCSKALRTCGVHAGNVVSICMANTPEAVIAFYAANKIGAIANMIHPLSAEDEIKNSLNATNTKLLIAFDFTYGKIKNILNQTDVCHTVIVTPNNSMPFHLGVGYYVIKGRKHLPKLDKDAMFWTDFINKGKHEGERGFVKTSKEQPALILHSGGTSGTPKNIILSNGNVNVVIEQVKIQFPKLNETDNMLGILPIFHCFGLVVGIHVPLCVGATVTLIPQFDANRFDKLLTNDIASIFSS